MLCHENAPMLTLICAYMLCYENTSGLAWGVARTRPRYVLILDPLHSTIKSKNKVDVQNNILYTLREASRVGKIAIFHL